ncbi:hypothetical protein [Halalkalicoccus sp. NIPERK01]|uniref:DUF7289 family protein n=1 Tax=Halalkalicoccus sp. NIPERK01 TaxID=3053469 RepID=UPI00256EC858|nr:hypothetical protein [Halalkalicoccus sp. NIPERK01]MDL5360452.1 hypothetical protein [Halalkalicoccus sp. NIPERK01]
MSDDRAVSEVLGFVLTFSLITATIAIVFTVGFAGLQDAQHAEQVNNVERAFDVLATNVDEVHREGAPSRSTEMRLAGGQLAFGDPTTVTIAVEGNTTTIETRPLVYSSGDTDIVYELGGIIRTDSGTSVMLDEPGYVLNDGRSSIPLLITTKPSDQTATGGQRTVLVRSSYQYTEPLHPRTTENETVTITIDSPRADAWERYFERQKVGTVEPMESDTTVEYAINRDEAESETSVSATWIRFRFV